MNINALKSNYQALDHAAQLAHAAYFSGAIDFHQLKAAKDARALAFKKLAQAIKARATTQSK